MQKWDSLPFAKISLMFQKGTSSGTNAKSTGDYFIKDYLSIYSGH